MQKYFRFLFAVLIMAIHVTSCTNRSTSAAFNSKEDSLKFARAVYVRYATEVRQDKLDTSWMPGDVGVHPISWDTVQAYQAFYDKEPQIFNPQNQPYKGFGIDANGYAWIVKNKAIKGLYLRLGRKGDGSYTIMLLGTDSSGNILQKKNLGTAVGTDGEPSNFDNVAACPSLCPED